ncbi:hypothetical protein [Phenylobacterium sp.]|uniref:hypothetical protein n=1 Tax=Phenylobacterium sp. TaxID=1871053 RepID=UPI0025FF0B97|nr:hypothetical protein [Phenylobacterium sp.]
MPQVDLSTLNGPELRRLLDTSRARGDASLSYQILKEMAARRESREARGRSAMRRPGEPRVVALNLGDPMEPEDEDEPPAEVEASPTEPAPRQARRRKPSAPVAVDEVAPEPPPSSELKPPRSVWDDDPAPPEDEAAGAKGLGLQLRPREPERPGPARGLRRGLAAGFAVGMAAGVALGWWAGQTTPEAPAPPVAPAAAPIQTAALEPPPAPAAVTAAGSASDVQAPSADSSEAAPSPEAAEVAPDDAEATQTPAASTEGDACTTEPTPADRAICGDPDLQRLQGELRQAYAEALDAHEDRELLRQRQLAWADARNTVSEPRRLARLYEERIRKLNAATAEARRQR